jgi:hypothetical protein
MTTRRVIRKDSLLYKLAYGPLKKEERPTGNVNLCDMVMSAMKFMLAFIILGVGLIAVCCIVVSVIALGGMTIGASVHRLSCCWLIRIYRP